jgi:hypothetical protein
MDWPRIKVWIIVSFSLAVIAIVIRSIWQIVVIPTPGTMLIFIPLILALLGVDILFAYLTLRPEELRSTSIACGITVALTAGLLAGVTHFIRFIISPLAEPFFSKIIGLFVILSSLIAYLLVLHIVWSLRKAAPG